MPKIRAGLLVSAIVVALALGIGVYAGADETPSTAQGLAAWGQVYSVLTHPRCINCHTATNYPQQGDDRHRHVANVVRGPEGKGVPGLNCAGCHQETHADWSESLHRNSGREPYYKASVNILEKTRGTEFAQH